MLNQYDVNRGIALRCPGSILCVFPGEMSVFSQFGQIGTPNALCPIVENEEPATSTSHSPFLETQIMLTRTHCSTTLCSTMFAAVTALTLFGSSAQVQAQNPVIDEWRRGSASYDPFDDHLYIDRERVRVRESALDPHRSHVDRGSKRYVDRYFRDAHGRLIREYGWTWTSHGVPHGKLTRERVTSYGSYRCPRTGRVIERDRDTVIYSQPGRGGTTERNRDTVIFSRPSRGGVTERNRDTVIFSQPDNDDRPRSRSNSTGRQVGKQVLNSLFGN